MKGAWTVMEQKCLSAFGREDKEILCMFDDCVNNGGGVCTKGYWPLSEKCEATKKVPERFVEKMYDRQFSMSDFDKLDLGNTSKGTQDKYVSKDRTVFVKTRFYYQGRFWNDDVVEVLASGIGEQFGFNCVRQRLGRLGGMDCVFSEFFTEKFVPFAKFDRAGDLTDFNGLDRLKFSIDLLWEKSGVDCGRYFYEMLLLDHLVCNEDRHTNNFGMFFDGEKYGIAKLFDFGLGLFEHDSIYLGMQLSDALAKISKKPFGERLPLIKWLECSYGFHRPESLDISRMVFPSSLAREYFNSALKSLEVRPC